MGQHGSGRHNLVGPCGAGRGAPSRAVGVQLSGGCRPHQASVAGRGAPSRPVSPRSDATAGLFGRSGAAPRRRRLSLSAMGARAHRVGRVAVRRWPRQQAPSAAASGSTAHRTPRGAIIMLLLFPHFIGANSCATIKLHWSTFTT
ncbi:hypothetical protein PAHAL_1G057500 [Panicum hallii]|jgi:hypothetical protein|uniref:Uncharacterized protein n=1 Tax=Panicum hallii TaxID=206008 RepID=A0A2S3GM68_9POAL|nr:hypothetical protein PAHAL_1G057500 [Panicum hallii]